MGLQHIGFVSVIFLTVHAFCWVLRKRIVFLIHFPPCLSYPLPSIYLVSLIYVPSIVSNVGGTELININSVGLRNPHSLDFLLKIKKKKIPEQGSELIMTNGNWELKQNVCKTLIV